MKHWTIRSILVPFDFSLPSRAALAVAKEAGARWEAQIELLHVRAFPAVYAGAVFGSGPSVLEPEPDAKRLRERLRKAAEGCTKARFHLLEGDPQALISRLGADAAADLIVMGTHGYAGIDRLLMPSVVESVARSAHAPVLSVHAGTERFAPRRVLAPVNFSGHSGDALAKAVLLAREYEAELHLLHVLEPWSYPTVAGEACTRHLEETAGAIRGVRVTTQLASGSAVTEILEAVEASRSDLVVLAAHPRRVGTEWMVGTTAERVLRHSPVPVLAVPTEARVPGKRRKASARVSAR